MDSITSLSRSPSPSLSTDSASVQVQPDALKGRKTESGNSSAPRLSTDKLQIGGKTNLFKQMRAQYKVRSYFRHEEQERRPSRIRAKGKESETPRTRATEKAPNPFVDKAAKKTALQNFKPVPKYDFGKNTYTTEGLPKAGSSREYGSRLQDPNIKKDAKIEPNHSLASKKAEVQQGGKSRFARFKEGMQRFTSLLKIFKPSRKVVTKADIEREQAKIPILSRTVLEGQTKLKEAKDIHKLKIQELNQPGAEHVVGRARVTVFHQKLQTAENILNQAQDEGATQLSPEDKQAFVTALKEGSEMMGDRLAYHLTDF